ncbi:hypothetical protein BJV82DRAFT_607782 [Fennellomyces sp. T-0311]|nr:hypothetical protein BJV82DRAFT_607782 [Fennellomyces sp. T-0311]
MSIQFSVCNIVQIWWFLKKFSGTRWHDQPHHLSWTKMINSKCNTPESERDTVAAQSLPLSNNEQLQDLTNAKQLQPTGDQQPVVKPSEAHVDFVTQSPYEILCAILSYIDTGSILQCIKVNRSWRKTIIQCPVPWRSIGVPSDEMVSGGKQATPAEICHLFPIIAQHIEHLGVSFTSGSMMRFFMLFKKCNLPRLQSLRFQEMVSKEHVNLSDYLFKDVLPYSAQTLTELEIISNGIDASLTTILSTCRGLTSLNLHIHQLVDMSYISLPHTTSLRTLSVYTSIPLDFLPFGLGTVLQCSPNLETLYLDFARPDLPGLLLFVRAHCRRLRSLRTTSYKFKHISYRHKENSSAALRPFDNLESLALGFLSPIYSLRAILERNCSSLKHLYICPAASDFDFEGWEFLATIAMPNLVELSINMELCYPIEFRSYLGSMLRHSPRLEILSMEDNREHTFEAHEPSFLVLSANTLIQMNHLSRLTLAFVDIRTPVFMDLLRHFQNQHKILQQLGLFACFDTTPNVFLEAAKIQSLEEFTVALEHDNRASTADAVEFARLVGQLPKLSSLHIYGMALTIEAVQSIAESTTLSKLLLTNVALPDEGAQMLATSIRSFEQHSYP